MNNLLSTSKFISNLKLSKNIRHLSTVNIESINKILDPHNRETKDSLKVLFKDPLFTPRYNLSLKEERDIAYDRIKKVCDQKLVSVRDFDSNPKNIFATHELLGMADGSLCTKFTVQFNLFGGTLFKLGTQKHKYLWDSIDDFSKVGCFGLTELGYGNNAVEMETTAHFDPQSQEFIINTPSTKAQKYWITNGAMHAHYCITIARLIMPSGKDEGLHAFLVPIRDENLKIEDKIKIWDLGYKIGLNGIDNAALWFDNVRIPKDNLLNAFSDIDNNEFDSKIKDDSERKRKRFIVLADQLLSGRICIASMCLGSTKMTLDTTIKYAKSRLTVGKKGFSDTAIMNYQLQKNELVPLIAKTYAYNFFLNYVQETFQQNNKLEDEVKRKELIMLCCLIKPLVTWHAENTATICRERCGGQGYLAINRFGEALAGSHAGITAEGDNKVIQQKVTKELLDTIDKNEVKKYYIKKLIPLAIKRQGLWYRHECFSERWYQELFEEREKILLNELALRLNNKKDKLFETWMYEESDMIQAVAHAHTHKLVIKEFLNVINEADSELKPILTDILNIYCMNEIKEDVGFFMEEGLLRIEEFSNLKKNLNNLNNKLGDIASDLTAGFGIPDWMHHAPIANNWQEYNKIENKGEIISNKYRE
ncbi:Acyl-CoA oxidase [seawater metagenome]|uniref:acyl-CoA oxidase n=1 Tax=seawater metagenome TaxID=1561972 RepID=A0A5E8CJL3_9ZZZZ